MLNTKFKEIDKLKVQAMTKLWTQLFAVGMQNNLGLLKTVLYLNDKFEGYYQTMSEQEVVIQCFKDMGVKYELKTK